MASRGRKNGTGTSMLAHNIVLWLVLYYGGLAVLGFGLWAVLPQALRVALGGLLGAESVR